MSRSPKDRSMMGSAYHADANFVPQLLSAALAYAARG
jgi:hypothetical protein